MGGSKPWQTCPPRGRAVELAAVRRLAAGPDPGTRPVVLRDGPRRLVFYRRTRFYLDRDAWEQLEAPDDVLVVRVAPTGVAPFTVALTRTELERTFGPVRQTRSWDDVRCYHFPVLPPAVAAFRVGVG